MTSAFECMNRALFIFFSLLQTAFSVFVGIFLPPGNLHKEIFTRSRVRISERWRSKASSIIKTFWNARYLDRHVPRYSSTWDIYYAFWLVLLYVEFDQKLRLNNWLSHEWKSEVDGYKRVWSIRSTIRSMWCDVSRWKVQTGLGSWL